MKEGQLSKGLASQLIGCAVQVEIEHTYPTNSAQLPEWQAGWFAFNQALHPLATSLLDQNVDRYGFTAKWARTNTGVHLQLLVADANSTKLEKVERLYTEFL